MKVTETKLPCVVIIEPDVFGDHRGYFMETYSTKKYEEIGQAINTELNRGVTLLNAKGYYTKEQIQVMTVIARKNQSPDLFNIIKCAIIKSNCNKRGSIALPEENHGNEF